jgi:hypothetical protein
LELATETDERETRKGRILGGEKSRAARENPGKITLIARDENEREIEGRTMAAPDWIKENNLQHGT